MILSELGMDAKLSSVIQNSTWSWPSIQIGDFLKMRMLANVITPKGTDNKPLWLPSLSRTSYVRDSWNRLRSKNPKISCFHLVWVKKAIPKHSFICWLCFFGYIVNQDVSA